MTGRGRGKQARGQAQRTRPSPASGRAAAAGGARKPSDRFLDVLDELYLLHGP